MNIPHFVWSFIFQRHLFAFTFWLLWIILPWTWVYKYLFETHFQFSLGILLEVELTDHMEILLLNLKNCLLDHVAILSLIFWRIALLISIVTAPFYIPSAVYKGSNFSTCSPTYLIFIKMSDWYSNVLNINIIFPAV